MDSDDDDDTVGYGKPPKQHRFQKGTSGNPAGSSLKSRTRDPMEPRNANLWAEEGDREITITENGRPVKITMARLNIRRSLMDGAAGKVSALRISMCNLPRAEKERRELWKERTANAAELQGQQAEELKRQIEAGIVNPIVIPHPDDIVMNPLTHEIEIRGPKTKEEYDEMLVIQKARDRLIDICDKLELNSGITEDDKKLLQKRLDQFNDYLPKRLYRPFPT